MEFAPGQVFKLFCGTCKTPKPKFFVVALVEPKLYCFVINSKMSELQKADQALAWEAVPLLKAKHGFLSHDSYLGCNQLFVEYTAKSLQLSVDADPKLYVGDLHEDAIAEALHRFESNISLPMKRVRELKMAWARTKEEDPA